MAAYSDDSGTARPAFRERSGDSATDSCESRCVTNRSPLLKHLSMGMSGDFEVAIEEGATLVRIGTTLFDGLEDE